ALGCPLAAPAARPPPAPGSARPARRRLRLYPPAPRRRQPPQLVGVVAAGARADAVRRQDLLGAGEPARAHRPPLPRSPRLARSDRRWPAPVGRTGRGILPW